MEATRPIVGWEDANRKEHGIRTFTFISGSIEFLSGGEVKIQLGLKSTRIFDDSLTGIDPRIMFHLMSSAVAPKDIEDGEMTISVDEAGNQLRFQVKYQDGTYKQGFVPLV